jgi:hypothetical protein
VQEGVEEPDDGSNGGACEQGSPRWLSASETGLLTPRVCLMSVVNSVMMPAVSAAALRTKAATSG